MGRRIGSLAFWAFIVITSLLLFPVALLIFVLTAPFDPRRRALHQFTCFWASLYTWCNPLWRVHVEHRDRIDPDTTYVMVANHLSLLDILVLFRLFTNFAWVSKIENFKVPVIGWNMRLNRYIPLVRGDKESAAVMMEQCRSTLQQGTSIMMFPEGTRSRDGQLQYFKPGAFELALQAELPILPILVTGTGDALPKRGFVLKGKHRIGITVLEPIEPAAFGTEDPKQLAEQVRDVIAAAGADADQSRQPEG
jgi:1-acyl-sn-glycerol-3-phosphate acyltransferase